MHVHKPTIYVMSPSACPAQLLLAVLASTLQKQSSNLFHSTKTNTKGISGFLHFTVAGEKEIELEKCSCGINLGLRWLDWQASNFKQPKMHLHVSLPALELRTLSHSMTQSDKSLQWTPCRKHQVPAQKKTSISYEYARLVIVCWETSICHNNVSACPKLDQRA